MLRTEDFIREFPVVKKTDRDVEDPVLLNFIESHPVDSLLDCGCHYSSHHYAKEIRPLVKTYDGIDILDDPETRQILNNYFVGNANTYPLTDYDMVICVSTIEHAGVSTYKGNHWEEAFNLFCNCLLHARKYMWISFPVGQEYTFPNELSIITDKQLKRFETITNNYKVKERFFYNQAGPQFGTPWKEHVKREVAVKIPYLDFVGNQSIAVLEIDKT